jgi:hypothetical protein
MWGERQDQTATAIVASNTVRSHPPDEAEFVPAVAIFYVARGAVTGNVIVNETDHPLDLVNFVSLAVGPAPTDANDPPIEVAVTGNALRGRASLPGRNVDPPLNPPFDRWDVLNQIIRV